MNARTFLTATLLAVSGLTAQAQVVSFSAATLPTGSQPRRVAFGDVTANGSPDLVTYNGGDNSLTIFRNNFFDFGIFLTNNGFGDTLRMFLTDFDNDGRADYILGTPGSGAAIKADADGAPYGTSVFFSSGGNLSLGDLDKDGLLDIIGDDGTVWHNDGNMNISAIWGFPLGIQSKGSQVADVNQDGKLDVILHDDTSEPGDTIYIALGNGDGTYANPLTPMAADELDALQVVDVNGDGLPDIAGYSAARHTFEVRLNLYNADFSAPVVYHTGAAPRDLLVGRFAASGTLTAAVLCADGNIEFWTNDNFGKLTGPTRISVGTGAINMAKTDYNSDSRDDLAVVNETANTVTVLTNTTPDQVEVRGTAGFQGRKSGVALPYTVLRARNSDGVESVSTLLADGTFDLFLPRGVWDIRFRADDFYLTSVVRVDTRNGSVSDVSVTLRAGDVNRDNAVDILDLLPLIAHYNRFGVGNYLPDADFNQDFRNDIADLLLLIGNYNRMGD